ncbi:Protein CBG04944 [Caenorhabditis briggsae]|uniref:Protein CBG04944 n=1 Tax=Caenorhabditis briggsae TaxID=6238 RepID=A8WYV3_CAEBR|nr:Protein CBG04944 [Caenorhabditis briggsae]CAP25561.2 Protein CBG04944 [Caenorhabditis briggsae]
MCFYGQEMTLFEEDSVIVLSESSASSTPSIPTSDDCCQICGDHFNNKRYGAPACLGCTVFFRRTIVKNLKYKCLRAGNCIISYTYRCACRSCRFEKCLQVGLRESAIQRRDLIGPRRKASRESSTNSQPSAFLGSFVQFQREQHAQHLPFFAAHDADVAFHRDSQNIVKYRRRARAQDVNIMMKLALKQANEWADRLKPFKKLSIEIKKSVLSEYFLAFLLIDSAYKTAKEADLGIWLLPNGSFMHNDYFFGLPQTTIDVEGIKVKTQLHHNFVTNILGTVVWPFRKLQLDETECAALKTILILKRTSTTSKNEIFFSISASCSKRAVYSGQEGVLAGVYTNCMEELMNHCMMKNFKTGAERFGEILLLISSIRCGVKSLYNQTRVSDLFSFMRFDDSVRDILLM